MPPPAAGLTAARDRCRAVLADVGVPDPFSVDAFLERLIAQRGRPIRLMPMDSSPGAPCGMWLKTERADYVFHERASTPLHRDHIVLHELGHLLCDHSSQAAGGDGALAQLLPGLSTETVRHVLGRTAYASRHEQEAEVFASLLLQRRPAPRPGTADASPETARLRRRLSATLARPEDGWSG